MQERNTESRLVGLAATDLPLALVPDLLDAVQRQAAAERVAAETEVIARLLAERDAELLALLQKKRAGATVVATVREFLEAHASHQVIVLSTDTETERRYFHDLQPHIARAYHLNCDDEKKGTVAEEGYFWD